MPAREASPSPSYSILFLTYKRADLIEDRIKEVGRLFSMRPDIELIVFDNGSIGPEINLTLLSLVEAASLNNWEMSFWTHHIEKNIGFGRAWNTIVPRASGDIVYLFSDDVQIFGDFIEPISETLRDNPRAIIGDTYLSGRTGWNEFGNHPPIAYLMGHFLSMKKSIWEELGGFDEQFYPYDYEDVDLCYHAQKSGVELLSINLPIHHRPAGTIGYNPDRYAHTVNMRALFAEKWNLPNEPKEP